MAKIVHCADIHFDTPFSARFTRSEAEAARGQQRDVFSKIIEEAKDADLLLIAGDLFDGEIVSEDTVRFIIRKFSELENTRIFIAAGNHDPYPIYRRYEWSENVHIFGTTPEYVELPELNLRIHGVSFGEEYIENSLLSDGTFELSPSMGNILVMHGEVGNGASRYNPIAEKSIEECGMDYVALGHIHRFSGVKKLGGISFAYPGTPQGRGFDELGVCGIIVGEVSRGGASLEFKPICESKYEILNVDISGAGDSEQIYETVLAAAKDCDRERDKIRFILSGRLSPEVRFSAELISKKLGEAFSYAELRDKTEPDVDYSELAKESGMRGIFVRNMLSKIEVSDGSEREKYELALRYGVEAMSRGEVEIC